MLSHEALQFLYIWLSFQNVCQSFYACCCNLQKFLDGLETEGPDLLKAICALGYGVLIMFGIRNVET